MRIHLFEFEDLKWFPDVIRQGMLDYLRFIFVVLDIYNPAAPLIKEALEQSGETKIIDLCSGGGGAIEELQNNLEELMHRHIPVIVCDKFPNINAYKHLKNISGGKIDFISEPIDAANVPAELNGLRTIFSAFHHFDKETAKKVLKNATDNKMPIAVFDGGDKNIFVLLGIIIFHPVIFFFCTPFIKPFKLSRIFFTYIIPLIPLCTVWDGVISILRLYKPRDMDKLVKELNTKNYIWKIGKIKHKIGLNVSYLTGYSV